MIDLRQLHTHYIDKYGRERVAELVGQKPAVVAMWAKSQKFPVDALQTLLEHDPEPLSAVRPLYENPPVGTKLALLMPLACPAKEKTMDCLLRLYDRQTMDFQRVYFNNLSVCRNKLAAIFLAGPAQESFWMDGDMVHPCGDAKKYKEMIEQPDYPDSYAGLNAINRLRYHRSEGGKPQATMVSCCYVSRSRKAIPQFNGGETSEGRMDLRLGPRDQIREKAWCGFGGVWIHRSVFEDIIRTQGDEIRIRPEAQLAKMFGYQYSFFTPTDNESMGDDVPFCRRVLKAGHKIHVDYAVQSAHVGDRVYTFKDV